MSNSNRKDFVRLGMVMLGLLVVLSRPGCSLPDSKGTPDSGRNNKAIVGIDVSHYQGVVDWGAGAEKEISFAYIKASEGTHIKDPYFERNANLALDANIVSGAYHFFDPRLSGREQANHFLQVLRGKRFQLPPVIDLEVAHGVEKAILLGRFNEMVAVVKEQAGCDPMIYSDVNFYKKYILNAFHGKSLWLARYGVKAAPVVEGNETLFWQKTDRGRVSFIKGSVDVSEYLGSQSDFVKLACDE